MSISMLAMRVDLSGGVHEYTRRRPFLYEDGAMWYQSWDRDFGTIVAMELPLYTNRGVTPPKLRTKGGVARGQEYYHTSLIGGEPMVCNLPWYTGKLWGDPWYRDEGDIIVDPGGMLLW